MPDSDTILLGSATGYAFDQIAHFVRSLRGCGYSGRLALLTHPLSEGDQAEFARYEIEAVPAEQTLLRLGEDFAYRRFHGPKWGRLHRSYPRLISALPLPGSTRAALLGRVNRLFHHIACSRYSYYLEYLKGPGKHCKQVILADVRDVVFQADPFTALDGVELGFALEPAHYRYGTGTPDDVWLRKLYGDSEWQELAGRRTSCCGTLFGSRAGMIRYLEIMCTEIARLGTRIMGYHGFDQGAHNWLWHAGKFGSPALFENFEGPVLTMGTAKPDDLHFDAEDRLLNRDGSVIAIVHQFDRHPEVESKLLARWSADAEN